MKYIYIKRSTSTKFVEYENPLDSELVNIGETWIDYLDNKWVPLSLELITFHEENPTASIREVWNMLITPIPVKTLEQAKLDKIQLIENYDSSDNVNEFIIVIPQEGLDDLEVYTWIDRETRADYKNSLDAAELLGRTEVTPVFNGMALTIPVSMAKMALAQIQLYANQCYNVTEQHKAAVNALTTVADVDAYDNETGYPQKLSFELPNEE